MKKLALVLVFALTLSLILSCGAANTPEATVEAYLKACIKLDTKGMAKYMSGAETGEAIPADDQTYTQLFKRLTYKIGDTTVTDDTAEVIVEITTLDMTTIMGEVMLAAFEQAFANIANEDFDSDEYMNTLMAEKMSSKDAPMVTNTSVVYLIKNNDGWILEDEIANYELLNAVTGGMSSIAESFN